MFKIKYFGMSCGQTFEFEIMQKPSKAFNINKGIN